MKKSIVALATCVLLTAGCSESPEESGGPTAFERRYEPLPSATTLITGATVLTGNGERLDDADVLIRDGKIAANWVINELFGRLKKEDHGIEESPVSAAQLGELIGLIKSGDISGKIAKDVFEICYTTGRNPAEIVETEGMKQVTDTGAIEQAVDEIIAANPAQVEKAKANPKLVGWFVGQVMKSTGGKANPAAVNQIVAGKLGL